MPAMQFQEHYLELNDEQKKAVDTIDGPVLVIAGPGSGKTQLLGLRVANILRLTDASPGSILCLTFTESACYNMRNRLKNLIGNGAYKIAIHTFHSFGTEVINQNPEYFFFGAGFQPTDTLGQLQILRKIFQELDWNNPLKKYHIDHDFVYLKDVQKSILALKKAGLGPQEFKKIVDSNQAFINHFQPLLQEFLSDRITKNTIANLPVFIENIEQIQINQSQEFNQTYADLKSIMLQSLEKVVFEIDQITEEKQKTKPLSEWKKAFTTLNHDKIIVFKDSEKFDKLLALQDIYEKYQKDMHKSGLFDFEDMLLEVVKAFEDEGMSELKYNYQEKYQYILVDEFQDTNEVQTRLLDNLVDSSVNQDRPNILVVGDDDQAVYKFQGASVNHILKFIEKYPKTLIVPLTKNYRSKQYILDFAMDIISGCSQRLANINGVEKTLVSMVED